MRSIFFFTLFSAIVYARDPLAYADSAEICKEQAKFENSVLAASRSANQATTLPELAKPLLDALKGKQLLLLGEGHLEGGRSRKFYELMIESFFKTPKLQSNCIFPEMGSGDYQAHYSECITQVKIKSGSDCEELLVLYPLVDVLRQAYQKGIAHVVPVDYDTRDYDQVKEFGESLAWHFRRNERMANSIVEHFKQQDCQQGIWVGGASHLSGSAGKDTASIPSLLRSTSQLNFLTVQLLTTQPGIIENSTVAIHDNRWVPDSNAELCNPKMPVVGRPWLVRKADVSGSYPLIRMGLSDGLPDSFGDWQDFDFSVIVDQQRLGRL